MKCNDVKKHILVQTYVIHFITPCGFISLCTLTQTKKKVKNAPMQITTEIDYDKATVL